MRCFLTLFLAAWVGCTVVAGADEPLEDEPMTAEEEEELHSAPPVLQRLATPDGRYLLEIYGSPANEESRRSVWVKAPGDKDFTFLAESENGIEEVAISDDGQWMVVTSHVSSGGSVEAFVRRRDNGKTRRFCDNHFALHRLRAGRIAGLRESDLPDERGRNVYCGLGLAERPTRLVFTFGFHLVLNYSLSEMRFTGWQRSLLVFLAQNESDSHFLLRLDELSDRRGIVLSLVENRRDGLDHYEPLVDFGLPAVIPITKGADATKEFRLRKDGEAGFIELAATRLEGTSASNEDHDENTKWSVTLTGEGAEFEALEARLTHERNSTEASKRTDAFWPTPMHFLATPH